MQVEVTAASAEFGCFPVKALAGESLKSILAGLLSSGERLCMGA